MSLIRSTRRREGDAIAIPGDYQARALESPRAAQRFWHAAKIRLIDRVAPARPHGRAADAGCGSGVIAAHLARTAREVVGFDPNAAAVSFATDTYGSDRSAENAEKSAESAENAEHGASLRFVLGPFERIVDEGPFDQIYCLEVLEHLYEEQAIETLRLFARAAAPGAQLFVTTPNARSAWPLIEWTLDRLQLVPTLDEAQHLTLFTRGMLRRAMDSSGWRVEDLGTFNGVAPFVAPVSERLARGIERVEFATRAVLPWSLLYARASLRSVQSSKFKVQSSKPEVPRGA